MGDLCGEPVEVRPGKLARCDLTAGHPVPHRALVTAPEGGLVWHEWGGEPVPAPIPEPMPVRVQARKVHGLTIEVIPGQIRLNYGPDAAGALTARDLHVLRTTVDQLLIGRLRENARRGIFDELDEEPA